MTYRIIALALLAIFYTIYIGKMVLQRTRGIKTDQMGKCQEGKKTSGPEKDKNVLTLELIMKTATYSVLAVEVASIILGRAVLGYTGRGILLKVFGTYIGIIADVIFFLSVWTMKDSWRAGINVSGDTKLINKGIYAFSRNPAFLGFDLMYLGILLMYFNWILFLFTIWAMVMLHIQILQEEKFLPELFGEEYIEYKKKTGRYLGRGEWNWNKVKCLVYALTAIFSVFYYITCVIYAGIKLSFVWIWLLLAVFSVVRVYMLVDVIAHEETGRELKFKIPKWLKWAYRIIFVTVLSMFLYVEANVVIYMNMAPEENLEYVIVLGAGLRGEMPTRPLYLRIQKAYNYMVRNPETMLIASGGRGNDEVISEAQVIYNTLVAMGLPPERIILEEQSTDTIENLRYSYQIIEARGDKGASVGLVTNGFHLYRARLIANTQGHGDICGVPAQTLFPVGIHYVVREFFGVVQLVLGLG